MAGAYTQDTRTGSFDTPLGKDKLVVKRFEGIERLSELFEYRIEAVSVDREPDFDKVIGKASTLTMETVGGGKRYFNGIVSRVRLLAETSENNEGAVYELVLRPWLWLLSKRRNSLIFHDKTAPEIIAEIFNGHGFASFEDDLSQRYPVLEYCVQYNESDMDFVRRLMEKHAIAFYFRHAEGGHTLVMKDMTQTYPSIANGRRPFVAAEKRHQQTTEHFFHWSAERRFTTGQITLNDYDFERPPASLEVTEQGDARYTNAAMEVYDYPGKYVVQDDGRDYARRQVEMERAEDGRFYALGDCISCLPGALMTLTDHPLRSQNKKYLILACTHSYVAESYRSTATPTEAGYRGSYEFMDAARPFAPPHVSPKPYIRGPQTARVVGEGEIDCDEYGRIKVRFHWDRKEDHSMRVRVSQVWASQQWGGIFIPRVDMEVIVDFLEGDPDRPIIIGCVYNGDNMPPYKLPDEKNIAGWKSNSTPGGGGYNEFVMDDTAGSELVRFHAQKDLDSTIENDEKRTIHNDRDTHIDVDDTLFVGNELSIEAVSKITLKVGGSTIVMDPVSITISSSNIEVDASAALTTKASAVASHTSDGPMTIQGAIIEIN